MIGEQFLGLAALKKQDVQSSAVVFSKPAWSTLNRSPT